MGNFTNLTILWLTIGLVSTMVVMAQMSIDPSSNKLFGNWVFEQYNILTNNIQGAGTDPNNWTYGQYGNATLPEQQTTGTLSSGFQFPDWINSGAVWIKGVASFFLNMLGAPYTLVSSLNILPAFASMIGAFWGILSLLIITNWVLGRDT